MRQVASLHQLTLLLNQSCKYPTRAIQFTSALLHSLRFVVYRVTPHFSCGRRDTARHGGVAMFSSQKPAHLFHAHD